MSQPSGKWGDLGTRLITGVVLATVGGFAVWTGGTWFLALVVLATGAMFWELARIARADDWHLAPLFGLAAAIAVGVLAGFPTIHASWAAMLLAVIFSYAARHLNFISMIYAGVLIVAPLVLVAIRETEGSLWILWLILVVVVSDVGGYVAGRMFGGPKFWPKISPKKTWSGTVAGWIGAAAVGAIMAPVLDAGLELILISAVLALAGQLGDIAESALKRRAGIKDSSNLLPGHGGVLDRMDALIGASLGFLLFMAAFGTPF